MKIIAFFINGDVRELNDVTVELANKVYQAEDLIAAVLLTFGDDFGAPIIRLEVETAAGESRTFHGHASYGRMNR